MDERARDLLAAELDEPANLHGLTSIDVTTALRAISAALSLPRSEEWREMVDAPYDETLIGLRMYPVGSQPFFVGTRYDLDSDALIDRWTGRWVRCTHYMRSLPAPPALTTGGE